MEGTDEESADTDEDLLEAMQDDDEEGEDE